MRRTGVAALGLASLVGCGVQVQDAPEAVPSDQQPALAASTPPDQPTEAVVYLVDEGRLVRDRLPAAGDSAPDALRALLAVTTPRGAQRTAVPAGTRLESVRQDGDLLAVDVGARFGEVRGRDQLLALAQIVFTATERAPVRRVRLTVEGQALPIPTDAGPTAGEPVTRASFASLAPG